MIRGMSTPPPPRPELTGHAAIAALTEYYADVIRTYESRLGQLVQVNGALRAEIERLQKKDETK